MADNYKCKFCKECNGYGCIGQLPGMGGTKKNRNFILNCSAWNEIYNEFSLLGKSYEIDSIDTPPSCLGIAPVTGACQNIGYEHEKDFYLPYFTAGKNCRITICAGDGFPDEKLKFGIEAGEILNEMPYFFLKPYPNENLYKRLDMIKQNALAAGMDIDAYNIVTMRNQVNLEKKTPSQINDFRKYSKLPLMLKGIFTLEDIELCKQVKPEIIVVSNHGGRIDTCTGSSANFLKKYSPILKNYCSELWVDGGIRTRKDIQTAIYLGAQKVLAARPFISSLCKDGVCGMEKCIEKMLNP